MKGIVFREFITMVETQFSLETADAIIADSTLATGGAYTTVGTYPHEEMVELVSHLSTRTAIAIPDLLRAFGHYLFQRFTVIHADYIIDHASALSVLRMLDGHIHAEVRKLYSDAELPSFDHEEQDDGSLVLIIVRAVHWLILPKAYCKAASRISTHPCKSSAKICPQTTVPIPASR